MNAEKKPSLKVKMKIRRRPERWRSGFETSTFRWSALVPLKEQSLRSAPSGRNSEQGLAPRSKYSRRYAAEYFGYRKSLRLREQTAGVRRRFFDSFTAVSLRRQRNGGEYKVKTLKKTAFLFPVLGSKKLLSTNNRIKIHKPSLFPPRFYYIIHL